ncbi:hypothetical protein BGZ98_001105 [Dissophora globulifera]|nr:hypothetical protein BGZ98_001105 [Dissophora globulifera]
MESPLTIISALQLLKYRGDPFSTLGGGMNWTGRAHGYEGGNIGGYQSLGDAMDDERDAEEISIPRHHSHSSRQHGRHRNSQQSSSFMTTSSRSTSVKSSRTGSGHNVEMGPNTNTHSGVHHGNGHGSPSPVGYTSMISGGVDGATTAAAKDDRRDKVGQNISEEDDEDEDEDGSNRETPAHANSENVRTGYQAF